MINRLRAFLTDHGANLDAVRNEHPDGTNQKRLIARGDRSQKNFQSWRLTGPERC